MAVDNEFTAQGIRGMPGVSDAGPDPNAMPPDDGAGAKVSSQEANYKELPGATKNAECDKVNVPGGVSSEGGTCSLWRGQPQAQGFTCGDCVHLGTADEENSESELPDEDDDAQQPMSQSGGGQGGSNLS